MKSQAFPILQDLEMRFREAVLNTPERRPWKDAERAEILGIARDCLGIREEWIPTVRPDVAFETTRDSVTVQGLRATSWAHCRGAAHLFLPADSSPARLPLVLLCCGHGVGGKQAPMYQQTAWRLAHAGCAVLVADNIGQGERSSMGHADVIRPFQCGTSLQGLIVMETAGWLRWALSDTRFDAQRIAAIGNSGGGTLTLFLGALFRDELAAVSSSGYPSTFDFIARKEKKHCHCNLLPGVIGRMEMWHLYGCIAPKPLFLFQGRNDNLFPADLFTPVARRVGEVYRRLDSGSAFRAELFPGDHAWDERRREGLAEFLVETLGLESGTAPVPPLGEPFGPCHDGWPDDALSTDALAVQVTGQRPNPADELYTVYAPDLETVPDEILNRGTFRQVAAQMNAFLAPAFRG